MKTVVAVLGCILAAAYTGCGGPATSPTITATAKAGGKGTTFTPTAVTVSVARKDTVTFKNADDRMHVIVIGSAAAVAAWPASTSPAVPTLPNGKPNPTFAACDSFRLSPSGTAGDSNVWTPSAKLVPPVTLSWKCIVPGHGGESGTITVNP